MDEARIHKLNFNGIHLLDRMDPNHAFVTELATAGCITWPQRQHLLDLVHERDRNEKLLEFIRRRSVADFENFIKVLSREQAHLVPLLVTDGGETYLMCSHFVICILNRFICPNSALRTFFVNSLLLHFMY